MSLFAMLLVIIGITILAVLWWLRHKSSKANQALSALYHLNQEVIQDPIQFVEKAWPILSQTSMLGFNASIEWFGVHSFEAHGTQKGEAKRYEIKEGGMSFSITCYRVGLKGEQAWLQDLIEKAFISLLQASVTAKQIQILSSEQRLEKLSLYLGHDVKNIAQFIQLLQNQLEEAQSHDQKVHLVKVLQGLVPAVRLRADRTLQKLLNPKAISETDKLISFGHLADQVAELLGLSLQHEGKADCQVEESVGLIVLDYLLDNFRQHGASHLPVIMQREVAPKAQAIVVYFYQETPSVSAEQYMRLFEPFWSTSTEGMGLGLYLAKTLLEEVGGMLQIDQTNGPLRFRIHMPCKSNPNFSLTGQDAHQHEKAFDKA